MYKKVFDYICTLLIMLTLYVIISSLHVHFSQKIIPADPNPCGIVKPIPLDEVQNGSIPGLQKETTSYPEGITP